MSLNLFHIIPNSKPNAYNFSIVHYFTLPHTVRLKQFNQLAQRTSSGMPTTFQCHLVMGSVVITSYQEEGLHCHLFTRPSR